MNDNIKSSKDKKWKYCPNCGQDIADIRETKYCIKCGVDIPHLKKKMELSINDKSPYPQNKFIPARQDEHKLSDDEIYNTKERDLWGIKVSIIIPILALFIMMAISAVFIVIYILINFDLTSADFDSLYTIIDTIYLDNYFIIILSVLELIFILIPVIYIRKYLQNPSIKNRLALLGFTSRGMSKKDLTKEIGIGLLFAIIGIILVLSISFLLELIFPYIDSSEMDTLLFSSLNVVQLILYMLIMIFIIGPSEEILFRGFMQKGLIRSQLGVKGGIILSAFIFAMIHVALFIYDFGYFFILFIPYFAISLLLGLLYHWRNENLIAVMIMHGVYDALTLLIFFFI